MSATPTTFAPDFSDVLIQAMAETQDEYAALKALHRHDGKWDKVRAAFVRKIFMELRLTPPPKGADRWTEKLLDAAAHSDPRYLAFIAKGTAEAAKFEHLTDLRAAMAVEVEQQNHNPRR